MAHSQIVKWGNSLAVRIPKPVAEEAGVGEGDAIIVEAGKGHIKLRRKDPVPSLRALVAQITPENRYDEISEGPAQGKERLEW
jgi:antitoxin MazE